MKERLLKAFGEHREELTTLITRLTTELVACRTVNAGRDRLQEFPYLTVPGQESKAVAVIARTLDDWSIPYEIHEGAPQRGNILAHYSSGSPVLMVGCHLDTVPPGEADLWQTDPFVVEEKDGQLYGRGVLDNLGPMAASLAAMRLLQLAGIELQGTFQVAGIASEEFREPGEPDPGIEFLLQEGLIAPDMAIIPDIGEEMKFIDVAEKGRAVLRVVTRGIQAHGSTPERGVNAVWMMARVLAALEELELSHTAHPILGSPSMNLGIARGGDAANIVPNRCEAIIDVRLVPGQSAQGIRDEVAAAAAGAIARYGKSTGVGVEVTIDTSVGPHAMAADHPLVKTIQASVQAAAGFTPQPFGIGGGTFCKAFNLGGIPAVGFGPGRDDQFHVVNEHIGQDELVQFALVCALIACDLLR